MKKEEFVEYIERIKSYIEKETNIDKALRALSPDFGGFAMNEILDDLVKLLAKVVQDNNKWLDYYIWETDCGENDCADGVTDEDGTRIPFKTPEDVYNLIIDEQIDEKDDVITHYLTDQLNKYKKLYENEKDHSDTLQKIIDKIAAPIIDNCMPNDSKYAGTIAKTTTTGANKYTADELLKEMKKAVEDANKKHSNSMSLDELIDVIADELLKEFK